MGQVRHGSATTTHAVRAAIQRSQLLNLGADRLALGISRQAVLACFQKFLWPGVIQALADHWS